MTMTIADSANYPNVNMGAGAFRGILRMHLCPLITIYCPGSKVKGARVCVCVVKPGNRGKVGKEREKEEKGRLHTQ